MALGLSGFLAFRFPGLQNIEVLGWEKPEPKPRGLRDFALGLELVLPS